MTTSVERAIEELTQERNKLTFAIDVLVGLNSTGHLVQPGHVITNPRRRTFGKEARQRMREAQRARWKKWHERKAKREEKKQGKRNG